MTNPRPAAISSDTRLAQLFSAPQLGEQTLLGVRTVAALRLLALCGPAARDPLLELTGRFASIPAARAFIALADAMGAAWPVDMMVMRPCCRQLSPDEATLAAMANAAASGDQPGFAAAITGLVRADRHERLFDRLVEFVALLQLADTPR